MKYIFILKLLAQDPSTGEIFWDEAIRVENLTFQVCIENLVDVVDTLQNEGIQHDVYCEKMPLETSDDEEDDK